MYILKRMGPRTDPCGTPSDSVRGLVLCFSMYIEYVRSLSSSSSRSSSSSSSSSSPVVVLSRRCNSIV